MLVLRSAVACLGLLLLLLPSGAAQADDPVAGQVYLSFVPDGRVQDLQIGANTPFDFYLIVDVDLAGGDPYRLVAIEGELAFGTELFFSQIVWTGGPWANVGAGLVDPGFYDFITATAGCLELVDGPNVICTFHSVLQEEATNLFVDIGPSRTSSFGGIGPGWVTCDPLVGYLFEPDGAPGGLRINGPTAVENTSWGRIKALYQN